MKNALFFDTEMNGWQRARPGVEDNTPRCIQLAWSLAEIKTGAVLSEQDFLIKPDKWAIPKTKWFKDHGFSTYTNYQYGHPLPVVLDRFLEDYNKADVLVSHNILFDKRILGAELKRCDKKAAKVLPTICTMASTKAFCGLVDKRGNAKIPKMEELYEFIFKTTFSGAHNAKHDVMALRLCFFELLKHNVIQL